MIQNNSNLIDAGDISISPAAPNLDYFQSPGNASPDVEGTGQGGDDARGDGGTLPKVSAFNMQNFGGSSGDLIDRPQDVGYDAMGRGLVSNESLGQLFRQGVGAGAKTGGDLSDMVKDQYQRMNMEEMGDNYGAGILK